MDKLTFSETAISAALWYEFASNGANHELTTEVLVVATDSTLEFLAGPLNLVERIVVMSDDFNDGRIFSIARQIRLQGYRRRLTVVGDILPDQYTALRSCGFDDVLLLDDIATAQVVALDKALALTAVPDPVSPKLEPFNLAGPSQ